MLDSSILEFNENTDDFMDETGKTIRWRRTFEIQEAVYEKTWCRKGERILNEIETESYLTQLEEDIFDRLEARRRAISNWKRLKIVIVILKMCNGRLEEKEMQKEKK